MSPLRVALLAVFIGSTLCQYYDYDYHPSMMLGPSGPNCAQECECPIRFSSAMYCENRRLKTIPVIPRGIKYLYLQNNNIEEIKAASFVNATDLLWLVLDNNQITNGAIEKAAFAKMVHLEKLFFSYNNLTEPVGPLAKSMTELKMIKNKLAKFPAGTLSGLENLTSVHLQENELTSDGIAGAFKGLKSLIYLDVSQNKLTKMPTGLPSSMEVLYADHNDIGSLPKDYLNKLPSLQYLRISHNKLQDSGIPAGVFNVSSLIELDLSFNRLQTIPEVHENLENLYLQVNLIKKFDVGSFCKFPGMLSYSKLKHLRLDGNNLTRTSVPFEAANCLRQATEVTVEDTD
ncbi:lumican-like [Megalops cyprinoides]|uniref:lumican-like n=1 Tax=Megalops cyprinoides TaxID=118141 RepID=UPI001863E6F1|nr:lumican-like [Megalops cyprinoides]